MLDQANHLRRLASHRCGANDVRTPRRRVPRLALLLGARSNVGASTLALNLAAAMGQLDVRPLLVDANPRGGQAPLPPRAPDAPSLADVLSERRRLGEVVCRGADGLRFVPGARTIERLSDYPPGAYLPLVLQMRSPDTEADWVLFDAGEARSDLGRRMVGLADLVILATTPEPGSVIDAFDAIKLVAAATDTTAVLASVTRAVAVETAEEVGSRLASATRRFLGFELELLPPLAEQLVVRQEATRGRAIATTSPEGAVGRAMIRAARQLVETPRIRRPVGGPGLEVIGPFRAAWPRDDKQENPPWSCGGQQR